MLALDLWFVEESSIRFNEPTDALIYNPFPPFVTLYDRHGIYAMDILG